MRKDVKAKWVAMLRSGRFKQAQGALKVTGTGYCCLGVLCELHRRETGKGKWKKLEGYDQDPAYIPDKGYGSDTDLPSAVRSWARLTENNPALKGGEYQFSGRSLAALNDAGHDFKQIADLIEEHL